MLKLTQSKMKIAILRGQLILLALFSLSQAAQPAIPADSLAGAADLYQSRNLQFSFLLEHRPTADSTALLFRQEADYFAGQGDWETALDLLNQAIGLLSDEPAKNSPPDMPAPDAVSPHPTPATTFPGNAWRWSAETGFDYSRQEYEMSLIESDSVVVEQLNNPYLSLRLTRNGRTGAKNYRIYNYLRGDRTLLQASSLFSLESDQTASRWQIEGESNLFWQLQDQQGSFWENQVRGSWDFPLGPADRLNFYSLARYKYHFPADSSYGDVTQAEMTLTYRHYLGFLSWLALDVRPSYYNENQLLGLKYGQIQGHLEFSQRKDYNRYLNAELTYNHRNFQNRMPDSLAKNSYRSLRPQLNAELPLLYPFGIAIQSEWEFRRYGHPNISYSNFYRGTLGAQLRFYFGGFNAVGAGFVYEQETHNAPVESEQSLVEQENFHAGGLLLSVDLFQQNGLLISLTYQYTLRTYPNSGAGDFLGYYSNRRIHSIQGIGYVPLGRRWQVQFLANYDNDRDRDREANDNFSTIFNLSLIYQF